MKFTPAVLLALFLALPALPADTPHWVVTWGASPAPQLPDMNQVRTAKLLFENQTLREIVHTSIGGDSVRLRLSNAYGKDAVEIASAHVALRDKGSSIVSGSDRAITFGGRSSVSIPPNGLVLSDPVKLNVPSAGDLAVGAAVACGARGSGVVVQVRIPWRQDPDRDW